mgnify:CR=1 FL=1
MNKIHFRVISGQPETDSERQPLHFDHCDHVDFNLENFSIDSH